MKLHFMTRSRTAGSVASPSASKIIKQNFAGLQAQLLCVECCIKTTTTTTTTTTKEEEH